MNRVISSRTGPFLRFLTATALAGLLFGVGCSDDDEGGNGGTPTPTTSLTGAFVGQGDGGSMSVTVSTATLAPGLRAAKLEIGAGGSRILRPGSAGAANVGASGSLDLSGGSTVALTGTYSEESDTLNLTGGGYTFLGVYDSTGSFPGIVGQYMGPSGVGFFGCLVGAGVQAFCGTFVNAGVTNEGRWNMIIAGDEVAGGAVTYGTPEIIGLEGDVTGTGNPRTITLIGGDGGNTLTATGTWDTTTNIVTGTWETSDGVSVVDSGTWEGSPCE